MGRMAAAVPGEVRPLACAALVPVLLGDGVVLMGAVAAATTAKWVAKVIQRICPGANSLTGDQSNSRHETSDRMATTVRQVVLGKGAL